MKRSTDLFVLWLIFAGAIGASAQQVDGDGDSPAGRRTGARVLVAAPIVAALPAPRIDGVLDDAIWDTAMVATDFVMFEPNSGAPASQRTEARIAYDGSAIYVAMRMFDSSPDSIVAQLARRDQIVHSDWVFVAIDSYFDRRTAFAFGVNPRGVKADRLLYDDRLESESWDAIWDVATATDSLGWTAEFRIPLSQLRFSPGTDREARVWGVQFRRLVARTGETSFWAPVPRDGNRVVSMFGELRGLRGITPQRNLELLPYSVAQLTRAPGDAANPFFRANDPHMSVGADMKFGLTPNLTVSATFNPDFGQVEADPSVVNLTAFETFLPEKRPFFVEGANIFNFGIGVGDGELGNESLFYSRRIGRSPQGSAPGGVLFSDARAATTILGAAKLSGKTSGGWSIGVLDAVTGPAYARFVQPGGAHGRAAIEPATNYAVARMARDFDAGRGAIGAIATATNRHLDDGLSFLRSAAYTTGIDSRRRIGNVDLSAWLVGSLIQGDTAAIGAAQRSATRYFQRPDNEHASYDPTRTSLGGWSASAQALKLSGGHWRMAGVGYVRSPGFEVNDLGYMQRADQLFGAAMLGYEQYIPSRHVRRWNLDVTHWMAWNFGGDRILDGGTFNASITLSNFWGANGNIERDHGGVDVVALRGGPAFIRPGQWRGNLNLFTDQRKPLRVRLNAGLSREDESGGGSWRVSPTITWRPSSQTELSLAPAYTSAGRPWHYITRRTVLEEPRYVLGNLEQTTASLTTRLSYTASPTLSVQFYAQPFISTGRHGRFVEVSDPRATTFAERVTRYADARVTYDDAGRRYDIDRDGDGTADLQFGDPDFNFKQMRTNAVVRWEYLPGSSLYIVWSHGRTAQDDYGEFRFGRDVSDLWTAAGTNVLLIKLSYWLGL